MFTFSLRYIMLNIAKPKYTKEKKLQIKNMAVTKKLGANLNNCDNLI